MRHRHINKILTLIMVFAIIGSGLLVSCSVKPEDAVNQIDLIKRGEEWSYLEQPEDDRFTDTEWTRLSYDASEWPAGKAAFGYSPNEIESLKKGTILQNTKGKANPVYFRKIINVADVSKIQKLTVSVDYDDGFVLYINSELVLVHNVTNLRSAAAPHATEDYVPLLEEDFKTIERKIDFSLLINGDNVIAVEVWNNNRNNNDIYFDLSLTANQPLKNYSYTRLNFSPGKNSSEMNFCWHTEKDPEGCVIQVAKKSDMTGDKFPVDKARTFTGKITDASAGFSSNKVTVTELEKSTQYVYRIGDGNEENWSEVMHFSTQDPENFKFIFVSDAQIGAGGHEKDTAVWIKTLATALEHVPETSFILHGGDHVNTGDNEREWDGFFMPPQLRNVPVVGVIGNHESKEPNFSYHFNYPNRTEYGATGAGTNYYFSYGNALFIVLNTNNESFKEHEDTIKKAIESHPDAKWRIIATHFNLFPASTEHEDKGGIVNLRSGLLPVIKKYDIDVVLSGHDHVYSRTKIIKGVKVNEELVYIDESTVENPDGTLFVTANCASSSKYYAVSNKLEKFMDVISQTRTPSYSVVTVDNEKFRITTYSATFKGVLDTFAIVKR